MSDSSWPQGLQHARLCSLIISLSLPKLMSIASVMPSTLLPFSPRAVNLSHHQGFFQWVGYLHQVAKVLELQLQHQSYQRIFRVNFLQNDRFDDLFAVQETFSCLFQHHSWKVLILWCSAFFMVQLSHLHMTLEKTLLWLYAYLCLWQSDISAF